MKKLFTVILVHHQQMRSAPAEMRSLQPLTGMRTVVLVNRRISGKALTAVEYLTGVLVGQIPVSVVAQSADGLVGLVKPDGAAPVTVGRAFGIVRPRSYIPYSTRRCQP